MPDHDNSSHLCAGNLCNFGGTSSLRLVILLKSFAFFQFPRMGHICLHDLERKSGLEQGEDLRMSEKFQLAKEKYKNTVSQYHMKNFHIADYILSE